MYTEYGDHDNYKIFCEHPRLSFIMMTLPLSDCLFNLVTQVYVHFTVGD